MQSISRESTTMRYLFLTIITLFSISFASAQTIDELERSIAKAQADIDNGNRLLKANASKTSKALDNIIITNRNIKSRETIINSLNKQTRIIRSNINTNNSKISSLSSELKTEKELYAKMMFNAYKRYLSNANLLFLFGASSLTDFHMRIYYLHRYSMMKQELTQKIIHTTDEILDQTNVLSERQKELERTQNKVQSEIKKLEGEKREYNVLHASLRRESGKLKNQITAAERQKRDLTRQIQKIIEEEQKRRSQKTLTEADIKLSADFAANKGKLPHPVQRGTIVEQFGTHRHPLYPTIMVENKGINVTADAGSQVRSIFNGEVVRVFFLQGLNNSVMVRHGDYISVYSGLTTVSVEKGDRVLTGQSLGRLADSGSTATLHFELHKGKVAQNPESWLR